MLDLFEYLTLGALGYLIRFIAGALGLTLLIYAAVKFKKTIPASINQTPTTQPSNPRQLSSQPPDLISLPAVPDVLDPERIRNDLQTLQNSPHIFRLFYKQLSIHFTSSSQRQVLSQMLGLFQVGRQVIEENIELQKAYGRYLQLQSELDSDLQIRKKRTELELARLEKELAEADAGKEEALYRKAENAHKRNLFNQRVSELSQTDNGPEMRNDNAAQYRTDRDSIIKDFKESIDEEMRDLWEADNNPAYSDKERADLKDFIKKEYERKRTQMKTDFYSFKDK